MKTKKYNPYLFLLPFIVLFLVFIVIPVIMAMILSFTNFNAIQFPKSVGFLNYINLLTQDDIFMQKVLPNTIFFAVIVGPGGYMVTFLLAWALAQLPKIPRTILALIIYAPSMIPPVAAIQLWRILFSGNKSGLINSVLLELGIITEPIMFLLSPAWLMPIMIIVALWSSMGVGFLAMLAGVLNIDDSIYEAGAIDGIKNRFQEMIHITIPSMKPQMLFGAVMAIVGTFSNGAIGPLLSGVNPTPLYAGQLMANHIDDYGFIRYEMGYAAAVSVVLLLIIYMFSAFSKKLFGEKE